jgi:GMP synthase-like glutamine amidotransferase
MKIGILQAGHTPERVTQSVGDYSAMYADLLKGHDFTFQTWSVVDMEFPTDPSDADGWLVSGSKHGAYEDHAFIPPLEDLIRDIVAKERPLIGVCFGHQIIAQALGGKVEKFENGWAVGHQTYNIGGEDFALNAWHQDQVTQLPETAERVGSSSFCENAMLHYKGKALTIQPHPEFDSRVVDILIETRGAAVPQALKDHARDALSLPNHNAHMGNRLAHFLKTKSLA